MYYNMTLQEHQDSWVYVITFGKNTPTAIGQAAQYRDRFDSAQDLHGTRHFVLYKNGKIV
jgi:hypothetical protein